MFKKFEIYLIQKNLKEFTMCYNKIYVFLLTDIFKNFRDLSLRTYSIDHSRSCTILEFACNFMLRKTVIQLELLSECDMHLFIEKD
jgi:hypothetical protein